MNIKEIKRGIKKSWNWVWHSDSIFSWIVALLLIFIFIKLIFFPVLSLIMGTSLPLAGIESSSMDHQIVKDGISRLSLCDEVYTKEDKEHINFNEYWEVCGNWYESNKNITKEEFSDFWLKNGFRKGDIIIVWGRFTPKVGDVIIFKPGAGSMAPRPIIHRIVDIDENNIIQTKGDHNEGQLTGSNNAYRTDETNIHEDQVIGKAIIKIPYLGWLKIWFVDLINIFRG
jgi:hypothetical protein